MVPLGSPQKNVLQSYSVNRCLHVITNVKVFPCIGKQTQLPLQKGSISFALFSLHKPLPCSHCKLIHPAHSVSLCLQKDPNRETTRRLSEQAASFSMNKSKNICCRQIGTVDGVAKFPCLVGFSNPYGGTWSADITRG